MWLYGGDLEAIRRDIAGSRHDDDEVRRRSEECHDERGYLLDPHSAIAYLGLKSVRRRRRESGRTARRCVPRDRASGEVRGDRRAGDRPADRQAAAARRSAGDAAADSGDRRDPRRRRAGPWPEVTYVYRADVLDARASGTASGRRRARLRSSPAASCATCTVTSCVCCAIGCCARFPEAGIRRTASSRCATPIASCRSVAREWLALDELGELTA